MIVYSKVTTAAATLPVNLEDVKAHLRVDGTEDDALILSLIKVAINECEAYAGLSFITQTRTVKLDYFNGSDVILPYGPVTSVTSVTYYDGDDVQQTVDAADYTLDTQSGLSKIRVTESWPSTNVTLNNVVVTYVAGYADQASVPEVIKLAIKERVLFHYQHRGDEQAESFHWMDLLDTVKVYWNAEY